MLINLRNALMAGKRLPYDAEVEFLESDGNAYAVVPNNIFSKHTGLRVELTLSTGSATLSAVSVLLAAGGDIQGPPYYYRVAIDKTAQFASPGVQWFSLFTDGDVHTVSTTNVDLTNTSIRTNTDVDGTRVLSGSYSSAKKTFDDTVGIFAFNNGNNKCPAGIRIYSIVAFDENGNKTADFIPVRKGTVGYLYDRVSGKLFGNAGTGDFMLGQDVVPVEWLDNGGTAYINTEYIFKTKPRVATNCMINSGLDKDLFGTPIVDASCFIFNPALNNGSTWLYYRYGSVSALYAAASKPPVGQKMHIDASDKVYIDDALILTRTGTYDFSQGSTPCHIFAARSILPSRIYDLSMWDGDALVRKYLPVRVGTDATSWEGAMMDVLTRRIYRNAGTGAFTYGSDLRYPIPAE